MSSPIWCTHNKIQQILNIQQKIEKLSERINATNPKIRNLKANCDDFVAAAAFDQKTVFLIYKYLQTPASSTRTLYHFILDSQKQSRNS
ncbi:hypothetical protein CEXT_608801 [Caerostris extrusa]|uniref:Uncharacterized protein n=1 Tax=Caerostris extrusa TaxID=172846 RepID=A0AAV4TZ59_CAEEX|nr:hypothetical protein CEXT_608801 [Caerostris extrusa]